jgi:uncharacterized repeat protein (TIGR03803 family)
MGASESFRSSRLFRSGKPDQGDGPRAHGVRLGLLILGAAALAMFTAPSGYATSVQVGSKYKILFTFANIRGTHPAAGLVEDRSGNLYGTALQGGVYGDGVVYELSPPPKGEKTWTQVVLLSFDKADGQYPSAGLTLDHAGNLYGVTRQGGGHVAGAVFELSPPAAGQTAWTDKTLYAFRADIGASPEGTLIVDRAGNLYGTTSSGGRGRDNAGGVFELSPPKAGQTAWSEKTILSFDETNGYEPTAGMIADSAGNLYGTTRGGGANHDGEVFELSPPARGQKGWTETLLFSFSPATGEIPGAPLITDSSGNLYGTTVEGGANGDGVVYELSPPATGQTTWTESVLLSFAASNDDVSTPGLVADDAGNLYGTTPAGGANNDGQVFELSPPAQGETSWTTAVLFSFSQQYGQTPEAGLMVDRAGNLYGTAYYGGASGEGVAFRVKP